MKRITKILCCEIFFGTLIFGFPQVIAASAIQIDGKLDEKEWKTAKVESGFTPLAQKSKDAGTPPFKTSFRWFADKDAFYLSVECEEPNMKDLKTDPGTNFTAEVAATDNVEVFLDPTGKGAEYYQFIVNPGGGKSNLYWIESGGTQGGEYGGEWDAAVSRGESAWTVEMRIPFTALYRTPSEQFSPDWKFNIARTHDTKGDWGPFTFTSWSPLQKGFHEIGSFRTLSGLPKKDPALDVYVESGGVEISHREGDHYLAKGVLRIQNDGRPLDKAKVEVRAGDEILGVREMALPKGMSVLEMDEIALKNPGAGKIDATIIGKDGDTLHKRWLTYRADYETVSVDFTEPFYANCIFPGQPFDGAKATVAVRLSAEDLKGAKLEVAQVSTTGKAWKETFAILEDGKAEIQIPKEAVQDGENAYRVQVVKNGKTLAESETVLRKLPLPEHGNVVYVDRALNLVINGRPVFFLGFMGSGQPMVYGMSLAAQREYGWNSAIRFATPAWEGWMYIQPDRLVPTDSADFTKDVEPSKEMYAATLKRIEEYRDKPSGLFYYLNDEPECRGVSRVYLGYLYRFIKKHDPYHPIAIVTRSPDRYVDCADILSPHRYTDPTILPDGTRGMGRSVASIADFVRTTRDAGHEKIVPWFTPQAVTYGFLNKNSVLPTFDETRAMIYTAITAGAKGLIPFSYSSVLRDTTSRLGYDFIYESLFMLEPYLIQPFPGLPVKVESEEDAVRVLLQKHEDNFALMMVNVSPTPATASLELPKEAAARTWYGFRTDATLKATKGRLELEFAPYEVKLFTTDQKVSPLLKSEARFRGELAEAQRKLHTPGNVLFGKGRDVLWTVSSISPSQMALRSLYRLCDGEKSDLGYRAGGQGEDEWIMMGFPQDPVRFQKIRLYGEEVAKFKLSYLKRGKWVDAGETEWDPANQSAEIVLPEPVSSVKIRLDLVSRPKAMKMEIYEVELLE